jgi:pyruvate formate lyase activating enzyme
MQTIRRSKRVTIGDFPVVAVERLSLSDYPGKLCANLITPGCNFRCPYCLKGNIILDFLTMNKMTEDQVIEFLHPRIGFLDGVCITGGEPTIHNELPAFLVRLKSIGALVKLDTNGSHPGRLKHYIERQLVDYVALDIKVPLNRYQKTVNYKITPEVIMNSVKLIRRSNVDYEFRTTMVPGILDEGDVLEIARMLSGSKRYVLQGFKQGETLSLECRDVEPFSESEMLQFQSLVAPYFGEVKLK